MLDSPLKSWEPDLRRACGQCTRSHITCGHFDRVMVLETATSTQDVARSSADLKPGLIVTALRQTAGRGRLGRTWADSENLGLAISFVVDPRKFAQGVLSLMAGLAAAWTVGDIADPRGTGTIGIKWPNDIIERSAPNRKISGVLIEQADGLAVIGIGINVHQSRTDFPPELVDRAASLAMLGAPTDRLEVATRLITRLNIALSLPVSEVVRRWRGLDAITGSVRTFDHVGQRITGRIIDISPLEAITVELSSGDQIRLPVMTTQLLKDPSSPN